MTKQKIIDVAKAYAKFDKPHMEFDNFFSIVEDDNQSTVVLDMQHDDSISTMISYCYSMILSSDEVVIHEYKAIYNGEMVQNQFEGYSLETLLSKKFTIEEGSLKMMESIQKKENDTNKVEAGVNIKNRIYSYEIPANFCLYSEDITTLNGTKKLSK